LSGEDFEKEIVVPTAGAAFHDQAVFARVLLEQCERRSENGALGGLKS
jgi:hypothetical protein